MDFMLDQVFTAGGDALARAYASRELYEHLVGLPKLGPARGARPPGGR
jgi:hypothetical protein